MPADHTPPPDAPQLAALHVLQRSLDIAISALRASHPLDADSRPAHADQLGQVTLDLSCALHRLIDAYDRAIRARSSRS